MRHSDSLILIWRLAELEARQLRASAIEPTHLLLALCKSVDLDLPCLVSKDSPDRDDVLEELLREVRRLRTIFRAAGLDARTFRRALRRMSGGNRSSRSESPRLRRSKAARQVFSDAERFAAVTGSLVFPAHLLYAVALLDDQLCDGQMEQLGVDRQRLRELAKRDVMFPFGSEKRSAGRN